VTGGKPIAFWLQSISGVSAFCRLLRRPLQKKEECYSFFLSDYPTTDSPTDFNAAFLNRKIHSRRIFEIITSLLGKRFFIRKAKLHYIRVKCFIEFKNIWIEKSHKTVRYFIYKVTNSICRKLSVEAIFVLIKHTLVKCIFIQYWCTIMYGALDWFRFLSGNVPSHKFNGSSNLQKSLVGDTVTARALPSWMEGFGNC
jgi:hypothetical protein